MADSWPDNVLRIELQHLLNGWEAQFHLDFGKETAWTTEEAVDVVDMVITQYTTHLLSVQCSSELTLVQAHVYILSDHAIDFYRTTGLPVSGGADVEAEPNQTSLVVAFHTGHAGRTGRGRIYLPGLGVGNRSGGLWTSVNIDAVNTFLSGVALYIADHPTIEWVVTSYKDSAAYLVSGWAARPVPGGLNRRRMGRGS